MPCFHPRHVHYHPTEKSVNGGKLIIWNAKDAAALNPLTLPCGQCAGCRLERSRQWAIRVVHEAQLHESNCFITLTFDDDHLPPASSLDHKYFQDFMRRFKSDHRYYHGKEAAKKLRFYMCGEYGENFGRPHFHACIFGHDFPDKERWKKIRGNQLYRSPLLERLWPFGFSSVGQLNFESAAYVARYIMKKRTGPDAPDHYEILDEYGEYKQRTPEYNKMSLKPGIAHDWFEKYSSDVYPSDEIILREKKLKPPKYYDKLYERIYPSDLEEIKFTRYQKGKKQKANNTPERLAVREEIQIAKLSLLKRTLE